MEQALPEFVVELPGLPAKVWVEGTLPSLPGVAIVGSRRSTSYGNRVAAQFAAAVVGCGWPVISGLARGIDGVAHRACLDAGGTGWAVLGSGLDTVYPKQHESLARELIATGGGLVSEYPPGTPPAPFRFPARNRIIAALAEVTVVIEAAVDGGALITARLALEMGKEVLAVPGDIDRPVSRGCNLLIRDGAHPVLGVDDLVELLSFALGPPPRQLSNRTSAHGATIEAALAQSEASVGETLADLIRRQLSE
ncbi:MAG: DNA-processing protein DprA [Actinobacteria bacterium]|nr:DNA-processing protein DprA [Actinomycetota bacterium]